METNIPQQTFIERLYKNKRGEISLIQMPNFPLIVWLMTRLALFVIPTQYTHLTNVLTTLSFGALFTWAWLELFKGENYLRQVLGFVVLLSLIYSKV